MEYVTGSWGTKVVLPPASLLFPGCLFPCPLAPWPASSYLLSVAHWSLLHLLPRPWPMHYHPTTLSLPSDCGDLGISQNRNEAWAAAILTLRWQSHGSFIKQLCRLGLLCIHNSGTDAFRTGILIPLEFCHCELGVTDLWKYRLPLAGSHLGPVSGQGKEAHRGAEPVYIMGTSLRVCSCSANILILKEAQHFMGY